MARISSITLNNEINYEVPVIITNLVQDPRAIDAHYQRLGSTYAEQMKSGKISMSQIYLMIHNIILNENILQAIKMHVSANFSKNYDETEMKQIEEMVSKKFENSENKPAESDLRKIAENIMFEELLWNHYSKELNISVSDEEVNKSLDAYYQQTNRSIRDYKTDSEKFEQARQQIMIQKTIAEVVKKFKIKLDINLKAN